MSLFIVEIKETNNPFVFRDTIIPFWQKDHVKFMAILSKCVFILSKCVNHCFSGQWSRKPASVALITVAVIFPVGRHAVS